MPATTDTSESDPPSPRRRRTLFPTAKLRGRHTLSMNAMLTLLVLASAAPLIVLLGWGLYRATAHEAKMAERLIQSTADDLARDTDTVMAEQARAATMLARRPALRQLDPARCTGLFEDSLAVRPGLLDIVTTGAKGQLVCRGHQPAGAPAPLAQADWPLLAGNKTNVIGPPQTYLDGEELTVPRAFPLLDANGALAGSVQMVMRLSALRTLVRRDLPDGAVALIFDSRGYVLARSAGEEQFVGKRFPDNIIIRHALKHQASQATAHGPDGIERLYSFRAIPGTSWFAAAGAPLEAVYAQARSRAWQLGLMAIGVLGLSGLLVLLVGRRISLPMRALTETAEQVARGQFHHRAPVAGPREIAEVAASFNDMLDRIPSIEQELRDSEERHRSLVELSPDGILVQQVGRIVYANPGFRRMFGLAQNASLEGLTLRGLAEPGSSRDLLAARLEKLRDEPGTTDPVELVMRSSDGKRLEVEHAGSSVRQQGQILVQSHLRNVTARNEARRDLQLANELLETRIRRRTEDLQATNEALGAFSYSVAHDLRAPLMSVNGFAQLAQAAVNAGDADKASSYTQRIVQNTRSMGLMIDGLLKLARSGRGGLDYESVDMQAMVRDVVQSLGSPPGIVIEALPQVPADAATIRQVWANLVSNAVKFSARQAVPDIRIGCRTEGAECVFSVRDNGTGFDPDTADKLFGPFQRLPGSAGFEGTGVGLAIVKRIVERHGGRVWAEGRPGEGATFYFSLQHTRVA
ncbi:ATP-binding protein [uncultured Ramlibacter sp.]|uniref:sensor histidine kinase n=1 Tax=uncultured Ramlibacter sp. TaxID=260755 RepID=UPI002624C475|nr:ATP-binding protein [uncultured Ramlibacter sp.]